MKLLNLEHLGTSGACKKTYIRNTSKFKFSPSLKTAEVYGIDVENNRQTRVDMEFLFECLFEISSPQATMYYFIYHLYTIALY